MALVEGEEAHTELPREEGACRIILVAAYKKEREKEKRKDKKKKRKRRKKI